MKFPHPLAVGLAAVLAAGLPEPSQAGPNANAKIILHLVPVVARRSVGCYSNIPKDSKSPVTAGDLKPQSYYAYVLVADFNAQEGLAGVQFGISYDDSAKVGVDIHSWQSCALYEWPMDAWPASETGNLLTWNQAEDCQEKDPLSVGFFYLTAYSVDRFKLIPRPVDNLAVVAVCGLTASNNKDLVDTIIPENLGWVDFGGGKGYNPWDPGQNLKNLQKRFKPLKD